MSQSLQNGIDTLLLMMSRRTIGVGELADELGVSKSTASRILASLQEANLLERNRDTAKYSLGPAIARLGEQLNASQSITAVARPFLERLMQEIHESVQVGSLVNEQAVVIEQVVSDARLVVNAKVGGMEPLYCSAMGKCLLAFASDETRARLLSRVNLVSRTSKTITDMGRLFKELDKIRQLGYAVDDEESSLDIKCVAVPIRNNRGAHVYALGVSGAASRMRDEKLNKVIPLMLKTSSDIHSQL